MAKYKNPTSFIMKYGVPFNFDFGWEEFDAFYHDRNMPEVLKNGGGPEMDPCTWPEKFKAEINRQRDEWVALYERWCKGEDDETTTTSTVVLG